MMKIHLIQSLLAKLKSPKQVASGSSAFPAVLEAAQIKEPSKQANTDKFTEPPVSTPAVFISTRHSIGHESIQSNLKRKASQTKVSSIAPAEVAVRDDVAPKRKNVQASLEKPVAILTTPSIQVDARARTNRSAETGASSVHTSEHSSDRKATLEETVTRLQDAGGIPATSAATLPPTTNWSRVNSSEGIRVASSAKAALNNGSVPKTPHRLVDRVEGAKSETIPAPTVERVHAAPKKSTDQSTEVSYAATSRATNNFQKETVGVANGSVLAKPVVHAESKAEKSPAQLRPPLLVSRTQKTTGQAIRESRPTILAANSEMAALVSKDATAQAAPISVKQSSVQSVKAVEQRPLPHVVPSRGVVQAKDATEQSAPISVKQSREMSVKETNRKPTVHRTDFTESARQSSPRPDIKTSVELPRDTGSAPTAKHAAANSEKAHALARSPEITNRQIADVSRAPFEVRIDNEHRESAHPLSQPAISTQSERTAPVSTRRDTQESKDFPRVQTASPALKPERLTRENASSVPAAKSEIAQVRQSDIPIPVVTRVRVAERMHVSNEPMERVGEALRHPDQSAKTSESKQVKEVEVVAAREKGVTTAERTVRPVAESPRNTASGSPIKSPVAERSPETKQTLQNSTALEREHTTSTPVKSDPAPVKGRDEEIERNTDLRSTRPTLTQPRMMSTREAEAELSLASEKQENGKDTTRETHQGTTSSIEKSVVDSPRATQIVNKPSATEQPHRTAPTERTAASAEPLTRTAIRAVANDKIEKTERNAQAAPPRSEKDPEQKVNESRGRVPEIVNEIGRQSETPTRVEIPRDVRPLIPLQKFADGSAARVTSQTEAPQNVVNAETSSEKVVSAPQTQDARPAFKKEPPDRIAEHPIDARTEPHKGEIVEDSAKHSEQVTPSVERVERKAEPLSAELKTPQSAREAAKTTPSFARISEATKAETISPLIQRHDSTPRSVQAQASTFAADWNAVRPVETFVSKDSEHRQGDAPQHETRNSERVSTEPIRSEAARNESPTQDTAKVTQSSEPNRETVSLPKAELQHVAKSALPWRDIQVRVEQALEQSRKRIVEPDHLNLSFFTNELGSFDIDIVRDKDKLSIRFGGESNVVTMMEEEKIQLVQWMRDQGYQVERVEFSSKGETASAFHRDSPQQNQERPEQLARGSARQAGLSNGGEAEANLSEDAIRPQVFGQRVWTA